MDIDDIVLRKHGLEAANTRQAADQSETNFMNCLGFAFRDKHDMRRRMDKHVSDKGRPSLIDAISRANERPTGWARHKMPGSVFTLKGWQEGAKAKRNNARRAREALPGIADRFYQDRDRASNAQQTYNDALARQPQPTTPDQAPESKPKAMAADHQRAPRVTGSMPEQAPQIAKEQPPKPERARPEADTKRAVDADRIREGMAARRAQEKEQERGR